MIANEWTVVRTKNPHPKKWKGPWFRFGKKGNLTGLAHYSVLASYIGGSAYRQVHDHFKCTRGIAHAVTVGGVVSQNLGYPDGRYITWEFKAK